MLFTYKAKSVLSLTSLLLLSSFLVACDSGDTSSPQQSQQSAPPPPTVSVAAVIDQPLNEWDEFTGRLQAPENVELRPQISGVIDAIHFQEGALVKAGDLLFAVDDRALTAEVNRLKAELISAKSRFSLAKSEYQRAKKLSQQNAISDEFVDEREAEFQQASSRINAVSAALALANVNLGYSQVTAPIDGRISSALVTKGNYITAGQTVLTRIVSTGKVYAYFNADEQTYLRYAKLARAGQRPSSRDHQTPVYMALANDQSYPHEGYIDFVDNQVDASTGTIRARAVFDNSNDVFIPGLFARLKLMGSATYDGILIDSKAIGTDLNNKFVLVLDQDNVVQYRSVIVGETVAGLRIVKKGLQAGDQIVVNGLQRVRPGTPVTPEIVDMASAEVRKQLSDLQERVKDAVSRHHSTVAESSVSSKADSKEG